MPTVDMSEAETFKYSRAWQVVYKTYPPVLRVLEKMGFHSGRQPWSLGTLNAKYGGEDLRRLLTAAGFEPAILAWKDSDEVLSMRKVDKRVFQWHIRLHTDGEIRGHYEYSSEGNPWRHTFEFEEAFKPDREFFAPLLREYLVVEPSANNSS